MQRRQLMATLWPEACSKTGSNCLNMVLMPVEEITLMSAAQIDKGKLVSNAQPRIRWMRIQCLSKMSEAKQFGGVIGQNFLSGLGIGCPVFQQIEQSHRADLVRKRQVRVVTAPNHPVGPG